MDSFSPKEVLTHPLSKALKQQLTNWEVIETKDGRIVLTLKTQEGRA